MSAVRAFVDTSEASAVVIDLSAVADVTDPGDTWLAAAAEGLRSCRCVLLRFGPGPGQAIRDRAIAAAEALTHNLRGGPGGIASDVALEVDHLQLGTHLAPGCTTRFLLPHTDGAHCSYLTPSTVDVSTWNDRNRAFASEGFHTTDAHKVVQGLFIAEKGTVSGDTMYYDLVPLMAVAHRHQTGRSAASAGELQSWLAANIDRALAAKEHHRSRYLSLPALLGAPDPVHGLLSFGARGEGGFSPLQHALFPDLARRIAECQCGTCTGPGMRLLCGGLQAASGLSWLDVRTHHEVRIEGRAHDLLLSDNLFRWHGADSASWDRVLQPLCMVAPGRGPHYEHWLSARWHERFDALLATSAVRD